MIGPDDIKASPKLSSVTDTVTLPGRPSDNQLEFGIPVIHNDTSDLLCLEFTPRGDCSAGTTTGDPISANSDTTPGLSESSADFIKADLRSSHCPSALSHEKSEDTVQDKTHFAEATGDGSVQCSTNGVGTATAESGRVVDASMDVSVGYDGCPGLSQCDSGLIEASFKPVQTGVSQEQCDEPTQDDWSFANDPLPGGLTSSQSHLDAHLNGTDIPCHSTDLNAGTRNSARDKNPGKRRLAKRLVYSAHLSWETFQSREARIIKQVIYI